MHNKIRHYRFNKGTHMIEIKGELDAHQSPEVDNYISNIMEEGGQLIALDLSKLQYADSTALRFMLQLNQKLSKKGGKLILIYPQGGFLQKLLGITETEGQFTHYDHRNQVIYDLQFPII